METIAETLAAGGSYMYLVLMTALPALVFALLHAILARRWTLLVALPLVLLPALVGALGYVVGTTRVEAALAAADPGRRAELAAVGESLARLPLYAGLGVTGLGALPLVVGLARRGGRREQRGA